MKVELWDITRPQPYERNPRKLPEKAIEKVAASIREFGFRQPIVVDDHGVILVGHTRLEAAKRLGLERVPVHVAKGLSEAQAKAYRLADNRVAKETDWENDALLDELRAIEGLDLDLSLTGFDLGELDALLKPGALDIADGILSGDNDADALVDTKATIGPYTFVIPRESYLEWIEGIKQTVGFDKQAVIAELRTRLGIEE